MQQPIIEINPYEDKYRQQIIEVWEKSVRATHDFVKPADIDYFKSIVETIDFNHFDVYCWVENEKVLGFVGVAENKVEMLFLEPEFIGQGYGKKLMDFAIQELKADQVDVNEQNTAAVRFYEKIGFVTYERMEKDSEGKDYPILKMKLKTKAAPILQTWDNLASIYNDKFMDLDLYDDTYDRFIQLIEKSNANIFEIGCGPGNITRYFLRKRPDFNILGIDLSPNMIELAKQNNPSAKFEVMDCRDIGQISDIYDGIVCGFCLPYLSKDETAKLIEDCASLLNQEGLLYLSAIEDDYAKSGYETSSDGRFKMHVYFHQADFLEECFNKNGFEIMDIKRKTYPKPNDRKDVHLIYIAKKIG